MLCNAGESKPIFVDVKILVCNLLKPDPKQGVLCTGVCISGVVTELLVHVFPFLSHEAKSIIIIMNNKLQINYQSRQ